MIDHYSGTKLSFLKMESGKSAVIWQRPSLRVKR